ncbi:MAG TPA: hypothetical protein VK188_09975 [Holophaga sp.]|nr:hypothetical protein [Holophaga sp.]
MNQALGAYLSEVESALRGLSSGRRRLIVRELEAHLRDEAEARDVQSEAQMASLLAEKEMPRELASQLSEGEDTDATHRSEASLLSGSLLGLATGGYLFLQGGWPWHLSLAFGLAHGLAVGTGILLVRRRWQTLAPWVRVITSAIFGTLMAIPLGFTSLRGFNVSRLLYGAFTGYMLERHSENRPAWVAILETLAFTAVDAFCWTFVFHHRRPYAWLLELSFNFTLALGVLVAIHLKRLIAGRWLLAPQ